MVGSLNTDLGHPRILTGISRWRAAWQCTAVLTGDAKNSIAPMVDISSLAMPMAIHALKQIEPSACGRPLRCKPPTVRRYIAMARMDVA